jgi:hypothetical protein
LDRQDVVLTVRADRRNAAQLRPAARVAANPPKTCHKKSSKRRASGLFLPGFTGLL